MTDLFFKGGETIRGFERAGYGPRDACENPIPDSAYLNCSQDSLGGELFWATTAEVRFPFPFVPDSIGMQGAFFVDAGSLWEPGQLAVHAVNDEGSFIFDSAAVRVSTGFSLIWQSPLGPLRADIAQALLKAELRQDRGLPLRRFNELLKQAISRYGFASWPMSRRAPLRLRWNILASSSVPAPSL